MWRGLGKRLTVLGVAGVVAIVAAELALRALKIDPRPHPMGPRYLHVRDPMLGLRLRPGFQGRFRHAEFDVHVAINAQRFRGAELEPKRADEFRILSLGDSFAFGYGVEQGQTYADVLEAELNANTALIEGRRARVCVVNAGVSSYGMWHSRVLMESLVDELDPDLILLSFFFANDLTDPRGPALTERGGVVLSLGEAEYVDQEPALLFSMRHTDLGFLCVYSWMKWKHGLVDPEHIRAEDLEDPSRLYSAPGLEFLALERTPEIEAFWNAAAEEIRAAMRTSAERGLPIALLNTPLEYQVRAETWRRVQEQRRIDPAEYDLERPRNWLRALADESSLAFFLDPSQELGELGPAERSHYPVNMHYTARGHARVGSFLARELAGHPALEAWRRRIAR